MSKKETTLSVLKDIRESNNEILKILQMDEFGKYIPYEKLSQVKDLGDKIKIYIPKITMKEIYEQSGNKTSQSTPLLYNIDWYKNEVFFTTETSREGWYEVSKELMPESRDKTWEEQEKILKGGIRLNAAEILYVLYAYEKEFKTKLLNGFNYHWTGSRSSRGDLVDVGGFGEDGARVGDDDPSGRRGSLGVCLAIGC